MPFPWIRWAIPVGETPWWGIYAVAAYVLIAAGLLAFMLYRWSHEWSA